MPCHSKSAGERCQGIVIVVNEEEMGFSRQASVLCEALVRSRGQCGRRDLRLWGRLARFRSAAGLALWQIDSKRCASAFVAGHRDRAVMVARSEERRVGKGCRFG